MNEMMILHKLDVIHHQLSILISLTIAKEMHETGQVSDENYSASVKQQFDHMLKLAEIEMEQMNSRQDFQTSR